MTSYLFRDRAPTSAELEELRLMLSTFRDGSGQQMRTTRTEPGWRDVERVVAAVTRGSANENKSVFDVWVPVDSGLPYGLSCKTSAVGRLDQSHLLSELHNSHAKAWSYLGGRGIDPVAEPAKAGLALIEQVTEWHEECAGFVDVSASSYVFIVHDRATWRHWRIAWLPLALDTVDPLTLTWEHVGKRIQGTTEDGHRLWEWYGWSGGQLKYYPPIKIAYWTSDWFELEGDVPAQDLRAKAAQAFPGNWPTTT